MDININPIILIICISIFVLFLEAYQDKIDSFKLIKHASANRISQWEFWIKIYTIRVGKITGCLFLKL